jgi:signal transduction histidine kinase/CheY-like chemotaxis protein/HPt (histidine-containing phosphotransfer) domain-containing protein
MIQRERQQAQELMQKFRTDSIVIYYRDTDALREEIENTMIQLMQSVQERQQYAQRLENRILMEDKRVMDRIWHHITLLEDHETMKDLEQAELAHQTVNRTTERIFIFVAVSMLILMIFSWLFVNDVNKSKYYRNQLIEERIKAEHLVEVKQRFMANISHEIRTPLNSIIGFSERLQKVKLGKEPDTYVRAINKSSGHLLDIVNDILDFSKIEAGKIKLRLKPFDIRLLVEEVHNTLSVIAEQKNIDFTLESGELQKPLLIGDPLRIKQILLNIAGNALKFTSEGWVKIQINDNLSTENPSLNVIRVRVSDSGPGISPEEKDRIFEEFSQADSRITRKYGGTGLGLSISKKLVEMMDGSIELYSQKGKGATFTIFLPLMVTDEIVSESKPGLTKTLDEPDMKVLVVDDDRLNRMLIRSIFDKYKGVIIAEADNAKSAIKMLSKNSYDLIISDVQMPDMSGIEMIQLLRNNNESSNSKIPAIACTADITTETMTELLNVGFMDCILKPFDESTLINKVLKFYDGQRDGTEASLPVTVIMEDRNENLAFIENELPFDLKKLKEFTGNDQQTIIPILEAFIEDTELNLSIIKKSIKKGDIDELSGVAHKMSNMFEMLGSDEAAMELKKLSRSKESGLTCEEIKLGFARIKPLAKKLIDGLSDYLKGIKEPA